MRNNLQENLQKLKDYKVQKFGEKKLTQPLFPYEDLESLVSQTEQRKIIFKPKPPKPEAKADNRFQETSKKIQILESPQNTKDPIKIEFFQVPISSKQNESQDILKRSENNFSPITSSSLPNSVLINRLPVDIFHSNPPDFKTSSISTTPKTFPEKTSPLNFPISEPSLQKSKTSDLASTLKSLHSPIPSTKSSSKPSQTQCFTSGFPWDNEVKRLNQQIFKNKSFRQNQQEIINAVLLGKDVFVIMPTGGGKSLTFQLPAVISPGISIVIMPLISLIIDQLKRLQDLGIGARELNSNQGMTEQNQVFDDIIQSNSIKILFATPEKLSQSTKLNWFLQKLEERGRLSRFVIDEAHCVSKWGREFRKDYMKLSKFRENFPNVPIVALTGTATEQVTEDVILNLNMKDPAIFKSSFNRPNLFFEVRTKTKNAVEQMFKVIEQRYPNDSGLIYCSTKKDCEKVVKKLKNLGISVEFFHSEVSYQDKLRIQNGWMKGTIRVLVATVAFGMGIDKQEVRFVFHFSIPKSLENYYQEAGRAGRDGRESLCTIFYKYSDKSKLDYLIGQSNEVEQQDLNFQELQSIIIYCEDIYTCRRKQQLAYFNEEFDPAACNKTCDNCQKGLLFIEKDVTEHVCTLIRILKNNREHLNTLIQIISFVQGKKCGKKDLSRFDGFAVLKDENRVVLEQTMKKMVQLDILKEKSVKLFKNNTMTKIEIGGNAWKVEKKQMRVLLKIEIPKVKEEKMDFDAIFPEIDLRLLDALEFQGLGNQDGEIEGKVQGKEKNHAENVFTKNLDFNFELNLDDVNLENLEKVPNLDSDHKRDLPEKVFDRENLLVESGQCFNMIQNNFELSLEDLDYPYLDIWNEPSSPHVPEKIQQSPSSIDFLMYGKSGSKDLYDEIVNRLITVREIVAKRLSKTRDEICSVSDIIKLGKELPSSGPYPSEFYSEIKFFKGLNQVRDDYKFSFNLETNSIESGLSSLKTSRSEKSSSITKQMKFS
jgi:RecQ family ATP-dependent DNA helicase